jgi:hypothetical protein
MAGGHHHHHVKDKYRVRGITVAFEVEDVGGHFERFLAECPKMVWEELRYAVNETASGVRYRMRANAPVGPDAPHIAQDIEASKARHKKKTGTVSAVVGYWTPKQAGPNNQSTQAEVALYNEYKPNAQPFMRPAAEAEASEFAGSVRDALKRIAGNFTVGSAPSRSSGGSGTGLV